jgi:glycosyltransferase involved in cell wall biosynthesis
LLLHALDRPLTGVTRVALELARALDRSDGCDLVLLSTSRETPELTGTRAVVEWLPGTARVPGLMALGGPMISLAARRLGLDVVHDPVGVSPFTLGRWAGRFARVLTVHDAIAFQYPDGYSWSNNLLHRRYVPATLRNVDAVITVSQAALSDIERFVTLPAGATAVIPNGVDAAFVPVPQLRAEAVARRHGLRLPYVLHVGSAQARKNVPGLLAAFARLRERQPAYSLALVGTAVPVGRPIRDAIDALGLASAVTAVGAVPSADLPALYSAAAVFAFPSLHEGFGLPVLEAMACGTPVVTAAIPALAETVGDAALLVDPRDADALGAAIERAAADLELRAMLRDRGLERAAGFTWDRAAQQTIAVYRAAWSNVLDRR